MSKIIDKIDNYLNESSSQSQYTFADWAKENKISLNSKNFDCSFSKLTSLQGAPKNVDGDYNCRDNKLTSLQGAPESVGGDFYCDTDKLTSLQGAPKTVGRNFYCGNNNKKFTEKDVRLVCNVKGRVIV